MIDIYVPLIEADWLAAVFIFVSVAVVYLGFSNLILSVIVESANEVRCNDRCYQASMNRRVRRQVVKELKELWKELEADGSITTITNMKDKWVSSKAFQDYFRSMDIEMAFLEHILSLITGADGQVSFADFTETVLQLKQADLSPSISILKYQVSTVLEQLSGLRGQIHELHLGVGVQIN